jgi:hypothetical protein
MAAVSIRNMNFSTGEDDLESTPFRVQFAIAVGHLKELMGDDFSEWFEAQEGQLLGDVLEAMNAKIVELERAKRGLSGGAREVVSMTSSIQQAAQ